MRVLISLVLILLYIPMVEYAAHRWVMHKPHPWRTVFYTKHAIQHHGKHRYDVNISIHPITCLVSAIPLLVASLLLGWSLALMTVAACFIYSWLWTSLHKAHHDLGCQWIKRIPFYKLLRLHHLKHHEQPNRNFGAVFTFSDYLFNTKIAIGFVLLTFSGGTHAKQPAPNEIGPPTHKCEVLVLNYHGFDHLFVVVPLLMGERRNPQMPCGWKYQVRSQTRPSTG